MNSFKTWFLLKLFAHIHDGIPLLLLTDRTGEMSNELFDFQKSNGVVTLIRGKSVFMYSSILKFRDSHIQMALGLDCP